MDQLQQAALFYAGFLKFKGWESFRKQRFGVGALQGGRVLFPPPAIWENYLQASSDMLHL